MDIRAVSNRVLGVPVRVVSSRGGLWVCEPPAVMVTVRGPAERVERLEPDSILVEARISGTRTPTSVRVAVTPPADMTASATPDTVVARRRRRD